MGFRRGRRRFHASLNAWILAHRVARGSDAWRPPFELRDTCGAEAEFDTIDV